jgi:hypothetical protein
MGRYLTCTRLARLLKNCIRDTAPRSPRYGAKSKWITRGCARYALSMSISGELQKMRCFIRVQGCDWIRRRKSVSVSSANILAPAERLGIGPTGEARSMNDLFGFLGLE